MDQPLASSTPPSGPDLSGRVAIVTGAGRGIGRAILRELLRAGAAVTAIDLDAAAVCDAVEEYAELGPTRFVIADVSHEDEVAAAVADAVAAFGHLDIVINNAALSAPTNAPVEALDRRVWEQVLAINLTGPMLVVKHALPHLRAGAVVNVASTRAHQSEPHTEAYAASKGGLVALTHALAVSLGPAVRVNCVSPGWIDTREFRPRGERDQPLEPLTDADHAQHPVGRVGRPEDVAALCRYLVSDQAGFVTGQEFVIDGGMTRKMIYEP
ncbi:glucose 1-dehydrogenase [Haliangium sp.]|uniref:glucose 1-dehydrogenase n=1 Tax=Haliangium sp. TaxID=2663208 RepID=UPI003D097EB0